MKWTKLLDHHPKMPTKTGLGRKVKDLQFLVHGMISPQPMTAGSLSAILHVPRPCKNMLSLSSFLLTSSLNPSTAFPLEKCQIDGLACHAS